VRKGILVWLALAGAALAEGKLGGTIAGGKARKLLQQGLPLLKEADDIYKRRYVLEEGTEDEQEAELRKAVELYDKGTALLQEALELQEDGGVNWRLTIAARNLARARAWILRRENARRAREHPTPPPPPPPDDSAPEKPAPEPPRPEPKPPEKTPRAPTLEEDERPVVATFHAGDPPAQPVDVALPRFPYDLEGFGKQDRKAIAARIHDYYQSLRPGKLLYRHRLCGGKGKLGDASCEECCGTGQAINLHHFRKVFWTSYTPLLRSAQGALEALEAFHARAARQPDLLGPEVKAVKILEIEYQGVWARARVELSTSEGKQEKTITLVSIGSTWFFYHPESDRELLEREGLK